jgi:hypothetical protein
MKLRRDAQRRRPVLVGEPVAFLRGLVAANGRARMLIATERRAIGDRRTAHMDDAAVARVKAGEHFDFGAEGFLGGGQLACEYRATRCEGFADHWSLPFVAWAPLPTYTLARGNCENKHHLSLSLSSSASSSSSHTFIWRTYLPLSEDEEEEDLA